MRLLSKALLIWICFSGFLNEALSQPHISHVEGTLGHYLTLTIMGSGFGPKENAQPFAWDDFQNGTKGEYLIDRDEPGGGVWDLQAYECRWPVYSDEIQRFSGDMSALQDFDGSRGPPQWPTGCGTNRGLGLIDRPSKVWYVSYWEYQDDWNNTALYSTNVKIYSHFMSSSWNNYGGQAFPRYDIRWQEQWHARGGFIAAGDCYTETPEDIIHQTGGVYRDHRNRWVRTETFLDMGTAGVADGYHAAFAELSLLAEYKGIMTPERCAEVSNAIGSWFIGLAFFDDNNAVLKRYLSELYVDYSFARVELGDASDWDECTHREIQIPLAWSDNSITIKGNMGSFTTGSPAYLFVVNEQNQPSAGFYVEVDQGNEPAEPPPPIRYTEPVIVSGCSIESNTSTFHVVAGLILVCILFYRCRHRKKKV